MFVDSHVNLHADQYAHELPLIIQRAREAGVGALLTISDTLATIPALEKMTYAYDNVWYSVGVHPHYVADHPHLDVLALVEAASAPRAIGIGECGLDHYYEHSDRVCQAHVFKQHIAAAQQTGLPLIIHARDADDDMRRILEEEYARSPFTPLMHCYTSGLDLAQTAVDMGGYVAFSGIITFKNAQDVRRVAEQLPLSRLLIETDCPYLAPVPRRGQCNEPSFLPLVADKLAEVKGVERAVVEQVTTENFFKLFTKATHVRGEG